MRLRPSATKATPSFCRSGDLALGIGARVNLRGRAGAAAAGERRQRFERGPRAAEMIDERAKRPRTDILAANKPQPIDPLLVRELDALPPLAHHAPNTPTLRLSLGREHMPKSSVESAKSAVCCSRGYGPAGGEQRRLHKGDNSANVHFRDRLRRSMSAGARCFRRGQVQAFSALRGGLSQCQTCECHVGPPAIFTIVTPAIIATPTARAGNSAISRRRLLNSRRSYLRCRGPAARYWRGASPIKQRQQREHRRLSSSYRATRERPASRHWR